jgi:hypothetical protein
VTFGPSSTLTGVLELEQPFQVGSSPLAFTLSISTADVPSDLQVWGGTTIDSCKVRDILLL